MSTPEKLQPRAIIGTISTEGKSHEDVEDYIEQIEDAYGGLWLSAQSDSWAAGFDITSVEGRRELDEVVKRESDMRVSRLKRGKTHQAILITVPLNSPVLKLWMKSLARVADAIEAQSATSRLSLFEDRSPNLN